TTIGKFGARHLYLSRSKQPGTSTLRHYISSKSAKEASYSLSYLASCLLFTLLPCSLFSFAVFFASFCMPVPLTNTTLAAGTCHAVEDQESSGLRTGSTMHWREGAFRLSE